MLICAVLLSSDISLSSRTSIWNLRSKRQLARVVPYPLKLPASLESTGLQALRFGNPFVHVAHEGKTFDCVALKNAISACKGDVLTFDEFDGTTIAHRQSLVMLKTVAVQLGGGGDLLQSAVVVNASGGARADQRLGGLQQDELNDDRAKVPLLIRGADSGAEFTRSSRK
ncbi:uncharacterized protein SCHCODRAFT_02716916 [Schizophyllum commune H4-8]|uniref:uncharacterized protein n=1 Tax=Schizophyllum commune (strain H4-8 / FGSC 9210) TaxID=578458 RepID=UPI00215FD180|nr:uncharacterized protein SCHCODRAFT_02716916 [Schizophyllum commune H4-8]KAI5886679.1 hypothetical protein SCHCODRAFT_02716916 [Schizophyllum commune H4-8]